MPQRPHASQGRGSMPPATNWRCLELADLPALSRFYLLFQPRLVNPFQEGLPTLDRIVFLDERLTGLPNLPPCPTGWRRCGMLAGTWRLEAHDLSLALMDTAWAFVFEWEPSVSGWEALLETQEQLRPQKLALGPQFLLPALFLARMAHFPLGEDNIAKGWTPVLAEMQTELLPVQHGLYVLWMGGPTLAAARYRRLTGCTRAPSQHEQTLLTRFERVVGDGMLEAARKAERLEPVLIRTLDETSARLWEQPQRLRADRLLRSLLAPACWRPEGAWPEELERLIPQSTLALVPLWRRWQEALRTGATTPRMAAYEASDYDHS